MAQAGHGTRAVQATAATKGGGGGPALRLGGRGPEDSDAPGEDALLDAPPPGQALRYGVLDVETRRSAEEVGGWGNARKMGVSVAVLYDSGLDDCLVFGQEDMAGLVAALARVDLVVGFNSRRFDYSVLSGLSDYDFHTLPTLDILEKVHARLGYRLSLDGLAGATLGAKKGASGLDALRWWKEGALDKITAYCRQDVLLTRDLYLFGAEHGYLLFTNKAGKMVRVPVAW